MLVFMVVKVNCDNYIFFIVLYGATPKMIHLNIQIWANFQKSPTKYGKNCKGQGAVFLALLVYHPNHDYVTI